MTSSFVTGATGLIGRALVPHLLARGPVQVLVRDPSRVPAEWAKCGGLRITNGDVTRTDLGLAGAPIKADHVFHLAGLYDLFASAQELERVNVAGTQNVIRTLRNDGFRGTLHHFSSVAVAGDHSGTMQEEALDVGQAHPHPYHRSKYEAERLVRSVSDLRWRVYRPTAVVGDSKTGEMDRIDGPYFLFEVIDRLRRKLPRWVTLPNYSGAEINMLPVDWVARAVDTIAHRDGLDGKTFHVVDPSPPSFVKSFNLVADAACSPRISERPSTLGRLAPGAREMISKLGSAKFLRSGLLEDLGVPPQVRLAISPEVSFDTTNLRAALGDLRPPNQAEYVAPLWDYYQRHLATARDVKGARRRRFAGQIALVTGASSGIGASLARDLAEAGAHVVLVARREPELAALVESIRAAGGSADHVAADLSELAACDEVVRVTLSRHGRLDLLVNNAGRSIRRPLLESLDRFHDLERTMQINYYAPARLIRGFLPGMKQRRSGTIVNVLSAGAHMPSPRFGAYTASKAALSQLGDTLAAEHVGDGIRITQAYLHWVRTPMMEATGAFEGNDAMTPDEAAAWVLDGVVEGKPKLLRPTDTRRYLFNLLAPRTLSRLLNVVYRVYREDDSDPELELDRQLAKRLFRGRPM